MKTDTQLVVSAKRLRDDLAELKKSLRRAYRRPTQQVTSRELREECSAIAESWLADLSRRPETISFVAPERLGDLNVHFQRLLVCAEHATVRSRYESPIKAILKNFTTEVVVPMMRGPIESRPSDSGRNRPAQEMSTADDSTENFIGTAFLAHSFAPADSEVVETISGLLEAIGIKVFTGEKPRAERISEKVKRLIDAQHLFVGLFTRKHKLAGTRGWNTSEWVIDEKAYAYGQKKKLILLKEKGVNSIGGIQGDYEFIEFDRKKLGNAVLQLLRLFSLTVYGVQK